MSGTNTKTDSNCISVRPKVRVAKTGDTQELIGEPIDKRLVKIIDYDGTEHSFPALHQRFSECLIYVKYRRPPKNSNGTSIESQNNEMDEWLETVITFEQNLRTILRLPFHRFWATVIHEKGIHLMLESYLLHAPRFFDPNTPLLNEQVKKSLNEIHKLVFKVYLRMSDFKESKKDHLSPSSFGKFVYEHYAFDVPKLIELCALYGNINQQINEKLLKIIDNLFKYQKAYVDDLQCSVIGVINSLQRMQRDNNATVSEVPSSSSNDSKFRSMKLSDLQDMIYFIVDLSVSLSTFVSLYSPAAKLYHKHGFESTLITFYENFFPALKDEIDSRCSQHLCNRQLAQEMLQQLTVARHYFIKCFRDILITSCINPLFDHNIDLGSKLPLIDDYLEIIGIAMTERCFSQDYFTKFPFIEDLSALMEQSELTGFRNVDQARIDYLLCSFNGQIVRTTCDSNGALAKIKTNGEHCRKNTEKRTNENVVCLNEKNSNSVEGEDQTTIDRATLESCISNITDIFPDIGHGFIEVCLEHYNNDVERVVDALLSGSLPESIDKLDRNMTRKPISSNVEKVTTNTAQRTDVKENLEPSNNLKQNFSQQQQPTFTRYSSRTCTTESEFKQNFTNKSPEGGQNVADTENLIDKDKVPNNFVASTSYMSHVKKPVPQIDEKTKEIIKLAAIRIENEYEDEYDDTYETVDASVVDTDLKFTSENEEKRRHPKAEKFFNKRV